MRRDEAPRAAEGYALARRALPLVLMCVGVVILALLLYYLVDVLLLAFAGALLAIVVRAPADWLAERTGISASWALGAVVVALVLLLGAAVWLFGAAIAAQIGTLWRRLPELIDQVRSWLADFEWLLGSFDPRAWLAEAGSTVGRGLGAIVATFGVVANLVIVLVIAVFFAAQPKLYVDGFLRLVPQARRARAHAVLQATGGVLRSWMLGQLFLMSVIAVITGIGLWALDMPLALALALLAGLLEFVPYVGPILSAIPAVLVALGESPQLAGYVIVLYIAIQAIEGNFLQPIVQQRAAHLAPAVILLAQLVLGVLIGTLGIVLATPLAASAQVMIRMLYIEGALHERAGPVPKS